MIGIICILSFMATLPVLPAATPTEALVERHSLLTSGLDPMWRNVALLPWRYSRSLTNAAVRGEMGSTIRQFKFRAETFLNDSVRTITGFADYTAARHTESVIYDTDDTDLLLPYVTFSGGSRFMNSETYYFGGSYTARRGVWAFGTSASYRARLSYRNVDPRPRNVTGLLSISPAIGFRFPSGYILSLSGGFQKYKQTSSIGFVSELGSNQIFHLTGLGTSYTRFDGSVGDTYYTSKTWEGTLSLFPIHAGWYTDAHISHTSVTQHFTNLNRLPATSTATLSLSAVAGWKCDNRAIGAEILWRCTRGTENIFGDPSSGQYPMIGSLTLWSSTRRRIFLWGAYDHRPFSASIRTGWSSLFEMRLDPDRRLEIQRWETEASFSAYHKLRNGIRLDGKASLSLTIPMRHSAIGIHAEVPELTPVTDHILEVCSILSSWRAGGNLSCRILFPLQNRFYLGGEFGYLHSIEGEDTLSASLQFLF